MQSQNLTQTKDFGFSWNDKRHSTVFEFQTLDDAYEFGRQKCKEFNVFEVWFYARIIDQDNEKLKLQCSEFLCDYW
jgi:hypothetical protein